MGGTIAGILLGTAAYMAPEQARGTKVDKRADIWAFGVVAWEMLTGERLFKGEDTVQVLRRVLEVAPDGQRWAVWDFGENPLFRKALPLRFFWFEEGLFVTAADPKSKDLLGAQVVTFDGRPAETVLRAMEPYIARDRGNPQVTKTRAPYLIRKLALLQAAGLANSADQVKLSVRGCRARYVMWSSRPTRKSLRSGTNCPRPLRG